MTGQLNTPRALIQWGARRFSAAGLVYAHGTDNATDEAAYLVLRALQIDYDQPDAVLDTPLDEDECARVRALLEQRLITRKPAAYLLNEAWFAGMPFYVDERVLVPRSPIAELIEARFAPWIHMDRVQDILDMCTGSGCIGIACAHAFPEARVTLSDISGDALAVARENIHRHRLESRVTAVVSDVFSALCGSRFDIIVVNPPYVPADEQVTLAEEFGHEPALGLFAGDDGLDVVARILATARQYLRDHGLLIVEVGHTRDNLMQAYPGVPFTWLEFEYGGGGVFLLDASQLDQYQSDFDRVAGQRTPATTTGSQS